MFTLGSSHRFFLYGGAVDMRKGFDGLSGLVRNTLDRDPLSGEVYIFLNRSRTLVKLLHWEAGGLVIYYKRLEKGTFQPPDGMEKGGKLPWSSLVLMVEGIRVLDSRQLPRYTRPWDFFQGFHSFFIDSRSGFWDIKALLDNGSGFLGILTKIRRGSPLIHGACGKLML